MEFVKCKNEREKLDAIAAYCQKMIDNCTYNINSYEMDKVNRFDYSDEIREERNKRERFTTIMRIIEADEYTSILVI
jgi:hypothetical protein